ncbi:hypothetical protein PI125_g14234 [Phytophthora idaei]|nr:hypothetical protein PI125_g14234 [Phytophthora idaei]
MPERRGSGSQMTVATRNRKEGPDRQAAAYARAIALLGEETVKRIRNDWDSWDTGQGGKEWAKSEGAVLQLLRQGLSERVIKAIIPVGGTRIGRLRKMLKSELKHFAHAESDSNRGTRLVVRI